MRFRLFIAVFAVIAASCGGAGDSTPAGSEAPSATTAATSEAPATSAGDGQGTATTAAPTADGPATEGPAAPALSTVLSDGSSFSLAEEANPVYLVFWAEW